MSESISSPAEYGFTQPEEQIAYYEAVTRGEQAAAVIAGIQLALTTHEAEHDTLTGLYNRHGFMRTAASKLASNPQGNYAFMLADIGNLKAVNDTSAKKHGKGDEVLATIGGRLQHNDHVAGRGGTRSDELLVMLDLDSVREENRRLSYPERLAATVGQFHRMGDDMRATDPELQRAEFFIAIGAYLPSELDKRAAESPRELIRVAMRRADQQLYEDKVSERHRLGFGTYRS